MPADRSRLVLGCWALADRNWPAQDRRDSLKTIHAALANGIRSFDTAQRYGNGLSEQLLGQQLKRFYHAIDRSELTVSTKILIPADADSTKDLVEVSLRRLCLDYIDVLYIHWPSSARDVRPVLDRLTDVVGTGMVRNLGLSNFPAAHIEALCSKYPIGYCQFPLSLMWRRPLDDVVPVCRRCGLTTVAYGSFGSGLLSGRYRSPEDLEKGDWRRNAFCFDERYRATFFKLTDRLSSAAAAAGTSNHAAAMAWTLKEPVDRLIIGSRTRTHLEQTLAELDNLPEALDLKEAETTACSLDRLIGSSSDNPFFHRW